MGLKSGGSKLGHGGSLNRGSSDGGSITPPVVLEGTPVNMILDLSATTNGTLLTAAMLNSGQIGTAGDKWSWAQSRTPLNHTFSSTASYTRRTPVSCDGADYAGVVTREIKFDHDYEIANPAVPVYDEFTGTPPAAYSDLIVSGLYKFNAVVGAEPAVGIDHINISGTSYVTMQQSLPSGGTGGTAGDLHVETQQSGATYKSTTIPVDTNVLYSCHLFFSGTTGRVSLVVMDAATGALIGTSDALSDVLGHTVAYVIIHDYLTWGGGKSFAGFLCFSHTANAVTPRESITVPDVTSASAVQSATGAITVSWDSRAISFKIERQHSGAWTTIETNKYAIALGGIGSYSYVDPGLTNGEAYNYRVTALIDTHGSSPVTVGAVTIDDVPFSGSWHDVIAPGTADTTTVLDPTYSHYAQITLPAGTINKLRLYYTEVGGDTNLKMALFDSTKHLVIGASALIPANLLTADWAEVPVTPTAIAAGNYWIGNIPDTSTYSARYQNAVGTMGYWNQAYASFPSNPFTEDGTVARKVVCGVWVY